MYRYVVTTNGLVLLNDPGIREWVLRHKYHLNLSVSISALRGVLGEGYLDKAGAVLDLVKANGGDVHYVVDDPERPGIYEEIIRLYEYGVPVVRISSARHWDMVRDKNEQFKELFRRVADYVYFSGEPKFGTEPMGHCVKKQHLSQIERHGAQGCAADFLRVWVFVSGREQQGRDISVRFLRQLSGVQDRGCVERV